jgi:hypothetical protein
MEKRKVVPIEEMLIKAIFFGTPGSGKTHLCASFNRDPRTAPALHIDVFGNVDYALVNDPTWTVISLTDAVELDVIYNFFRTGQPATHKLRAMLDLSPDQVFKTLSLDTVSDFQRLQIARILGIDLDAHITEITGPKLNDWTKISIATLTPIRQLVGLPVNVILTMQEFSAIDLEAATTKARPFLQGQAIQMAPSYVPLMGRMEWKDVPVAAGSRERELALITSFRTSSKEAFVKNDLTDRISKDVSWLTANKLLNLIQNTETLEVK